MLFRVKVAPATSDEAEVESVVVVGASAATLTAWLAEVLAAKAPVPANVARRV